MPQTGKMLYLVLEYCDGGDLDSFLNKHGRLPEATAKDLMRQLGTVGIRVFLFPEISEIKYWDLVLMCYSVLLCCF